MPDTQPHPSARALPQRGELWTYTRTHGSGDGTRRIREECVVIDTDHETVFFVTQSQQREMPLDEFFHRARKA